MKLWQWNNLIKESYKECEWIDVSTNIYDDYWENKRCVRHDLMEDDILKKRNNQTCSVYYKTIKNWLKYSSIK